MCRQPGWLQRDPEWASRSANCSTTVQVQDNFNQVPRTCNKQTCYDPQLQGCFIWHCHLSHDPLAATSLDHRCTLVQVTYKNVQDKYNMLQNHLKTEQWKLSTSWTAKPWQLWKLLHTLSNESTCATACKWHQTSYKWKQLTSNFKTVKRTSHELTSKREKNPKLFQLAKTYKPMNSFCSMFERILQTELDNPGHCTDSFCCFLDGFCNEKRLHQNNKNASKCKNHWCSQVQMTCKSLQSHWEKRLNRVQKAWSTLASKNKADPWRNKNNQRSDNSDDTQISRPEFRQQRKQRTNTKGAEATGSPGLPPTRWG